MNHRVMSAGMFTRLQKEYCDILTRPEEGISAGPRLGDKIFPHWDGYIHGPVNSKYDGGVFKLSIQFPDAYPFKPPKVKFVTKIVHCNISREGHISVDILGSCWSPALTIQKVLMAIRFLLEDPNPDDPLIPELAILLKKDPEEYYRQVREATLQYATPQPESDSDDGDL